jgi:hypothetical protein
MTDIFAHIELLDRKVAYSIFVVFYHSYYVLDPVHIHVGDILSSAIPHIVVPMDQ